MFLIRQRPVGCIPASKAYHTRVVSILNVDKAIVCGLQAVLQNEKKILNVLT
jgi:hypothetical protein